MSFNQDTSMESIVNGERAISAMEIEIPVPWGHISGKWWGPQDQQPIVAIHGWQDNAGTYDPLISLLPSDLAILAVDLPGHGYSSYISAGHIYNIFVDGLLVLRKIVKYYKWNKVRLLGHSLGGAISFLYASAYPDDVEYVISLDIVSPSVQNKQKLGEILGSVIDKFLKYESLDSKTVPSYEYEELLVLVEEAYKGSLTRDSVKVLMKRGAKATYDNRYVFTRDPRLKASSMGYFSLGTILALASRIKCSYLNIRGDPGLTFEYPEAYEKTLEVIEKSAKKFEYHKVEGTHHVHLNNPEKVAPIIKKFIST